MLKVVLDTNVLVSALIMKQGKPGQIIAQAHERTFSLLLADGILQETRVALHYKHIQKRFHPTDQSIEDFLSKLRVICTMVVIQQIEKIIPQDPPDNIVLACAVEGGADYLVSGNLHLLDLKQHRGVKIVTPAQFLEILKSTRSI
ncbi:MAG: putative toxin-antitoxin system toxin component, PIN family [Chloroflexi bacterium]|nr:putative toxin-antitoxin system toxin component, PIN family [Chloroflexota bacterium]